MLAVLGGSGVYDMEGLRNTRWVKVDSPFGKPSDEVLTKDPVGIRATIDQIAKRYKGQHISKVAGIESRGFIIGAPVAYLLGVGFVPIRKKG
ncbi:MAG: hypothetical protein ACT4P4_28830, partial [Betaproteobacteria bacterium]